MLIANAHNKKVQQSFRSEQELEQMDKAAKEALRLLRMSSRDGMQMPRSELQTVSTDVRIREDSGISEERESTSTRHIEPTAEVVQDEESKRMERTQAEV